MTGTGQAQQLELSGGLVQLILVVLYQKLLITWCFIRYSNKVDAEQSYLLQLIYSNIE